MPPQPAAVVVAVTAAAIDEDVRPKVAEMLAVTMVLAVVTMLAVPILAALPIAASGVPARTLAVTVAAASRDVTTLGAATVRVASLEGMTAAISAARVSATPSAAITAACVAATATITTAAAARVSTSAAITAAAAVAATATATVATTTPATATTPTTALANELDTIGGRNNDVLQACRGGRRGGRPHRKGHEGKTACESSRRY
ncbi:MAG: hypothetical protein ACREIB_06905 [Pseudomonadota bacterium]